MEDVRREDAMDSLMTCARGVARILMDLSESDSMDEDGRNALNVLAFALYNSVHEAECTLAR